MRPLDACVGFVLRSVLGRAVGSGTGLKPEKDGIKALPLEALRRGVAGSARQEKGYFERSLTQVRLSLQASGWQICFYHAPPRENFSPLPWSETLPTSPPRPPRPALPRLDDFPVRVPDIIRFGDMDRQGHVNNAMYSTYFESGRVGVMYDADDGLQVEGCTTVLARIELDYLKELRWPGSLEVGTGIAEIGRSSYVFTQALFHEGACAARCRATMVLIDRQTRKARPLPPELVERLTRLLVRTR